MKSQSISFLQAIAISLGAMIGWGAFVMPSDLFLRQSNLLGTAVAFLLGTLMVQLIVQAYIRLAKNEPTAGGAIFWIHQHLGKTHATIYGTGVLVGYITIIALNASAMTLLMRHFLPTSWQVGHLYQIDNWAVYASELMITLLILAFFVLINRRGLFMGAKAQLAISLLMVLAIFWLTGLSLAHATTHLPTLNSELPTLTKSSWLLILAVVPWAYIGFESTAHLASHIQNAHKKTQQIIHLSMISGLILYLLVNYFTAINFSFDYTALRQSTWATSDGIKTNIGTQGIIILSLAMTMAILSGINGFMLSTISLIQSMNILKLLPIKLSNYLSRHVVLPYFLFVVCASLLLLGRPYLLNLVRLASLTIAIGFVYVVIADLVAQRQRCERICIIDKLRLIIACGFVLLSFLA